MNQILVLLAEITVVLAVALLGARLASRRSAALRHLILASAFGIVLLLPLATALSPAITVEINALPAPASPAFTAAVLADELPAVLPDEVPASRLVPAGSPVMEEIAALTLPAPAAPVRTYRLTTWLLLGWAIIALMSLVPVGASLWRLRRIRRGSHAWPEGAAPLDQLIPATATRRPRVLISDAIAAPITAGLLRPAIMLPATAITWSPAHLANALLHELEHVRRHDWTVHLVSRAACALYWFHPLAWMAWRSLRLEAEQACDDAVLARADATSYAEQLLELARCLQGRPVLPGMQMAGDSSLAARIKALLDKGRPRGRANRAQRICVAAVAVSAIVVLAPLRAAGPHPPVKRRPAPSAAVPSPLPEPHRATELAAATPLSLPANTPIRYSGVRITSGEEPHAHGPLIEFCRMDGRWDGYMAEYTGLPADPPSARLEDLRVDESTGTVSFTARLTIGSTMLAGRFVPAERAYRFAGRLNGPDELVGTLLPRSNLEVLAKEAAGSMSMSCGQWHETWSRRIEARNPAADPRHGVVASILELVQSALADETTRTLDEIMYPITGLQHVQRYAQAVLDHAHVDPALHAGNYLEIINALNNTADLAENSVARPRAPGISAPQYLQLARQMRAKSSELAALVMPVTSTPNPSDATPDLRAANAVLQLTQMTRAESSAPGSPWRAWMLTELNTLDRAAQSVLGGRRDDPGATALSQSMFRVSLQSTALQAERISGRGDASPDARRRTSALAASLRDIATRLAASEVTAPTPAWASDSDWSITVRSAGPLSIGMPISQVRQIIGDPDAYLVQALNQIHALPREPDDAACGYLLTGAVPSQLGLMFNHGRLARVDVWRPGIRAPGTAMIGDSELKIRNLYGTQLTITQHQYGPVGAHYMTYTPADEAERDYLLRFETDGEQVTQFRIGLRAAVEATEGCS